ncbi:MAG TPA: LITAF-like zinc ribbon domain-containing protein [Pyrinomonadaceae bacterium]
MVQCQNCGQVNNYGSNFCRFCGTRMVAAQPTQPPPQQQQQPQQNKSYEYNPPKPYSWKTDEFQVQDARQQQQQRRTQEINRVQPLSNFNPPQAQSLAYQQAPAMTHGYRCPRCGTQNLPHIERKISPAGWIVFAVLLLIFFPLFWIGFFIKEDVRICPVCNLKVG